MLFLTMLLMNFFHAGTSTFMKIASVELEPFQIVFLRHLMATFCFLPFIFKRKITVLTRADFFRIIVCAFLAFTFSSLCQIFGVQTSQAMDGSLIAGVQPLMTIFFAFLFLKESLEKRMIAGLAVALFGFLFLSPLNAHLSPFSSERLLGNFFFLLSAAGEASFAIILKPLLKRHEPHLLAFYCLLCSSLYMFPFQDAALPAALSELTWTTWGAIAFLGGGCSFLGCFLWLSCLKRASVTAVAISWFLQPLIGCLYAMVLLGEGISSQGLLGGALILSALFLVVPLPMGYLRERFAALLPKFPHVAAVRIRHPRDILK